ncbi:MAG: DUF1343 domain-containing protein [Flavobacteriaceae bacterium]|nr:DUF1343 domain-containing protein [Flavobacteriaceae bacterium]
MAAMPIFIIGAETLLLYDLLPIMRFAIKYSNFNAEMKISLIKNTFLLCLLVVFACAGGQKKEEPVETSSKSNVIKPNNHALTIGAARLDEYLPLLKGRIGIVANQTSVIYHDNGISYTHLVDTLLSLKKNVVRVFAPEHGFRGTADAGELVKDGMDKKTGLPIISLYGENKKPAFSDSDLDHIIFDIQDVGARFYTYISTLHYVMEACAEQNIPLIVLDRPNPNGQMIDGPVLEEKHRSFVGMHPIPVTHGMTIGEYAKMINGEGWLDGGLTCNLTVIPMLNYSRSDPYQLKIKPSPNLPNDVAINLYPSLCFFEGTAVSAGRGTDMQFQVFGSPELNPEVFAFNFRPEPNAGAKYPKHTGKTCYGMDLRNHKRLDTLNLEWLIKAYQASLNKENFFNAFFEKLSGTDVLRSQIIAGLTTEEIRATWSEGLTDFRNTRQQYLIYD